MTKEVTVFVKESTACQVFLGVTYSKRVPEAAPIFWAGSAVGTLLAISTINVITIVSMICFITFVSLILDMPVLSCTSLLIS